MTAEQALANQILRVRTGSHLYGTSTPDSDEDFAGVFMPDVAHCLGMSRVENVDLSLVSKGEDGRNDSDAVDVTYYELRKLAALALQNNPNTLELLFVPPEHQVEVTDLGRRLLASARLFPYQGLYKRFIGYARSQRHKMVIRQDNYEDLTKALPVLKALAQDPETQQLTAMDLKYRKREYPVPGLVFNDTFARIGDQNYQYHRKVGDLAKGVQERLDKATHRTLLMERYGFDAKFGAHLVRLMYEGKRLLETGELIFPLPEAELMLEIRRGKYEMQEVIQMAESVEAEIQRIIDEGESVLPPRPRHAEVEGLVISMMKEHLAPEFRP